MKNTIKYWRKKADDLLTPLIKNLYPYCLLCGARTQVAHHFIHKSISTALRYYLPNLIPLCKNCHCALHHNESEYTGRIIKMKGLKWFRDLEKRKGKTVKADWRFYKDCVDNLSLTTNEEGVGLVKEG